MNKKTITAIIAIFMFLNITNAQAIDHTFTYQGELTDGGSPAQGVYDITIQAFDNVSATGSTLAVSPHTGVLVTAGVFTIQQVDLGSTLFDGMDVWLQIGVKKPADAAYTSLAPLQKMVSVPYANTLIDKGAIDGQILTFNNISGWQPSTPVNGTDDQNISGSGLSGSLLTIGIEGGSNQLIDLTTLKDGGAKKIDELTDAKSDSDGTDDGSSVFIGLGAGAADDSSHNRNVGVGYQSLFSNTTGNSNTANGYRSLFLNTTGRRNTANGYHSLFNNISGGSNTANGYQSLLSNTTGFNNTANGTESLATNTTGSENTSYGYRSLFSNTTGSDNTANGTRSLFFNTTGSNNTANGFGALLSNTTGSNNTTNGYRSLTTNTIGSDNTANGYQSLFSNTTGFNNTASGYRSLLFNTTGMRNTANGTESLSANITGSDNTANGYKSLSTNTTGSKNTSNGNESLSANTTGSDNTANGNSSLFSNTTGTRNTANGYQSLAFNTTGGFNTANGDFSLFSNTTGSQNSAIGSNSLAFIATGTRNSAVGYSSFSTNLNYSNSTALGYNAQPNGSNTIRLGNSDVTTIGGFANWTNVTDARFKTNIKEDVPGLEFIKKLRPVTYQLDMNAIAKFNKTPNNLRLGKSEKLKAAEIQTGFLAQEVEAAALSLGYDFHGVDKPKNKTSHYGLRYAEFVVPLVKAVQELAGSSKKFETQNQNYEVTTLQLQKQIETLKVDNQQLKDRLDDIEQLLLGDKQ